MGCKKDNDRSGDTFSNLFGKLKSVHTWHIYVQNKDIGGVPRLNFHYKIFATLKGLNYCLECSLLLIKINFDFFGYFFQFIWIIITNGYFYHEVPPERDRISFYLSL